MARIFTPLEMLTTFFREVQALLFSRFRNIYLPPLDSRDAKSGELNDIFPQYLLITDQKGVFMLILGDLCEVKAFLCSDNI